MQMRADVYLTENGYAESRNKASRLILSGSVFIDGVKVTKASLDISDGEHRVEMTDNEKFVGRGGYKLEAALENFSVDVSGKRFLDIGASTGGFTECLLMHGASYVTAVDSGRGQLHKRLVQNSNVRSIEGYNARNLCPEDVGIFDGAVMDVSFISQTLILPALSRVLCDGGCLVSLIKPQFEVGRANVGKKGIVKNKNIRHDAIKTVLSFAAECGLCPVGVMDSPILGGDGNYEYLAYFIKQEGNGVAAMSIDMLS